jgi:hypothetical protein
MSSSATDILKALPLPSFERPFGIQLWPLFDKAFTPIMGYHPQDIDFQGKRALIRRCLNAETRRDNLASLLSERIGQVERTQGRPE